MKTTPEGPLSADALEEAKAGSVLELLFRTARLTNEAALARVRERSGLPLRPAHTSLFPHIDLGGTRPTVIAERLGVSKQAVAPLVDELVDLEVLEKVDDPADGRAKLIVFARGGHRLLEGLAVLGEVEAELEARVGRRRIRALRSTLLELLDLAASMQPSD